MRVLFDLLLAFLLLGLLEALVKPIAKRFVQRRILRAAPLVLSQLDPFMPALLQQCSGAQLEQIVRTKLEVLTGELGGRGPEPVVSPVRSAHCC